MKRRIIALVTLVVLIVSVFAFNAFADTFSNSYSITGFAYTGSVSNPYNNYRVLQVRANPTGGSGITLGVYSDYARTNLIASASYPRTVNNPNYIVIGFPSGATRYFAAWPNITGELNTGTVAGNF